MSPRGVSEAAIAISDLSPEDFHYCATAKCDHKVPRRSHLLDACPKCGGTDYADVARKRAIEKGVPGAGASKAAEKPAAGGQQPNTPQLPDGATATPGTGAK